jgi:hypothetical protein
MSETNPASTTPLFAPIVLLPSVHKSVTSRDTATRVTPERVHERRRDVLNAIRSNGADGLARFQIAAILKVQDHVISSSVDALRKAGQVEESGRSIVNPVSGKRVAVLVAT